MPPGAHDSPDRETGPPERALRAEGSSAGEPDLSALMHRVSLGDEMAFSRLYDAVSPLLFGLIRRVVRDVSMSEEVLQEALLDIWRQATRFDPDRGSARSWMCSIAHRRAVDTVRASEAARRRDSDEGWKQLGETVADVQEEGIMRVEAQRVEAAMKTLTDLQADAIKLAYFGGYSHREVASLLDIPVGTAKTRIRDGMIALRDRLGVAS